MKNEDKTVTTENSDGEIYCPDCGRKYDVGNFCTSCGRKMVDICDCWKLNRRFDCGHKDCPTLGGLIKEFGDSILFPPK